jgi:hypothetical protein
MLLPAMVTPVGIVLAAGGLATPVAVAAATAMTTAATAAVLLAPVMTATMAIEKKQYELGK